MTHTLSAAPANPARLFTLAGVHIRQDAQGRYCLNDLHKAAVAQGANRRSKEPGKFFSSPRTQALLRLLEAEMAAENRPESDTRIWVSLSHDSDESITQNLGNAPVARNAGGSVEETGTYVCIELVIAYGQFVSAAFDLKTDLRGRYDHAGHYVVLRPIVNALGLDWKSQYSRIMRDEVLSCVVVTTTCQLPGDNQKHLTMKKHLANNPRQVLKTSRNSGQIAPSARFFCVHGVPNGRECDGYKTRKGKKSAQLFLGFELLPAPAQNGVQDSNRSKS